MKSIKYFFNLIAICIIGMSLVSCEDEDIKSWESTNISYMLTISPDLLKFVEPEVTYVDSQGKVCKISGVHELDNIMTVNHTQANFIDVWTIQTIKGTNYKCWTLTMNFKNKPFHSYFGVKYRKKDMVEDTEGKTYDFHHSIFSTTVYATSSVTTTTKLNWLGQTSTELGFGSGAVIQNYLSFTKESYFSGAEVEEYINNLVNTPDKAGFLISDEGKFTENTDFSM